MKSKRVSPRARTRTNGEERNKGGRPPKITVDPEGLAGLARIFCTLEEVASYYRWISTR